jgi:hypothetical protein
MTTGYFFRVQRDGHWQSIDLVDLTEEEIRTVVLTDARRTQWVLSLIVGLVKIIRETTEMP